MHINLNKRQEYFFLKGTFPGGCTIGAKGVNERKCRHACAPRVHPPGLNLQYAPVPLSSDYKVLNG